MIYSGWYGMSGEYLLISSIQVWCGELPSTDAIEPIHSSFYWSESDLDLEDKDHQISAYFSDPSDMCRLATRSRNEAFVLEKFNILINSGIQLN